MQPGLPFARVPHAYRGTQIHDDEVADALVAWRAFLHIEKLENRSEQVANLMIDGAVIGWVQGCSEFGSRALGNRSIPADPCVTSHKETINAMIKMHKGYLLRPNSKSMMVSESISDTQMRIAGEVGDC